MNAQVTNKPEKCVRLCSCAINLCCQLVELCIQGVLLVIRQFGFFNDLPNVAQAKVDFLLLGGIKFGITEFQIIPFGRAFHVFIYDFYSIFPVDLSNVSEHCIPVYLRIVVPQARGS